MQIGIIAALVEEAQACFSDEGQVSGEHPFALRRIAKSGHELIISTCGIGKVNATMTATMLTTRERCDLLLVVGTAGSIRPRNSNCFWVESAIQHDYGARHSDGFIHYPAGAWPIGHGSLVAFSAMADPGLGLPPARIASGDAFIACPDYGRGLAEALEADIVDMETAAVAQVAEVFGTPWAAIKAVSDDANGNSTGDFQHNLRTAAEVAGGAAERLVALL